MTVTLPDEMREELERKAEAAGYSSIADYLISLVERSEDRDEEVTAEMLGFTEEELETKLLASLDSGPPIEVTPQFWDELWARTGERPAK